MHFLLLILFIPFAFLLALIALTFLLLIASVLLEFPAVLLAAVGLGLLSHNLSKISGKPGVACEQM